MVQARPKFDRRKLSIFRPRPEEMATDLLPEGQANPEWMRVAKLDGKLVGAYAMRPAGDLEFELLGIAVAESHRGQGLGSWLLGHALGICEMKGARQIVLSAPASTSLFARFGFKPDGDALRLRLRPE